MKNLLLVITCSILLLSSCSSPNENSNFNDFAIYLLKDTMLTAFDVSAKEIKSLSLSSEPIITGKDFTNYNWKEHTFKLTQEAEADFKEFSNNKGNVRGVPFVVTVSEERIYLGTFWWLYSSLISPMCPTIETILQEPYSISIPKGIIDQRDDIRIYFALKRLNILEE